MRCVGSPNRKRNSNEMMGCDKMFQTPLSVCTCIFWKSCTRITGETRWVTQEAGLFAINLPIMEVTGTGVKVAEQGDDVGDRDAARAVGSSLPVPNRPCALSRCRPSAPASSPRPGPDAASARNCRLRGLCRDARSSKAIWPLASRPKNGMASDKSKHNCKSRMKKCRYSWSLAHVKASPKNWQIQGRGL